MLLITNLAPLLDGERAGDRLLDHHAQLVRHETIGRALRQQRLMPALQADRAHALALRLALHQHAAFFGTRRVGVVELDVFDCHVAVHDDDELVVRAGHPWRSAFRADGFDDVFEVLRHRDLFPGLRLTGDLEYIGKDVVLRIVVDDLDVALLVAIEGPEHGVKAHLLLRLSGFVSAIRTLVRYANLAYDRDMWLSSLRADF